MSRREAERLIRAHGGRVVDSPREADVVVIADDATETNARQLAQQTAHWVATLRESQFWAQLGLLEASEGVARLYTPAMLAELVAVPISQIRQWQRKGILRATREVRRLSYFDFEQVQIARKLADLRRAGCTAPMLYRKLDELARLRPAAPRPLADPDVVVDGSCLYVRRGESLSEPSGQLMIDFDGTSDEPEAKSDVAKEPISLPIFAAPSAPRPARRQTQPLTADELRALGAELEEEGQRAGAIEAYRGVLFSGAARPEDHFALAELLYLVGDLGGARERYMMAIESDEDYVEARSNLGCVLAEQGELELAAAAFRGALEYHSDYADAHFQLARILDQMQLADQATPHWRKFLALAPASPWADEAKSRVGGHVAGVRVHADGTTTAV